MNQPQTVSFCVYCSSAARLFSDDDLLTLLQQCRTDNARQSVTGMLLYKDGTFIQMIEGQSDVIDALYAKISLDERHRGLIMLVRGNMETRLFPTWSMGFVPAAQFSAEQNTQINDFLRMSAAGGENTMVRQKGMHPALKLLMDFRQYM